jgi:hypothetical protein
VERHAHPGIADLSAHLLERVDVVALDKNDQLPFAGTENVKGPHAGDLRGAHRQLD